MYQTVTETAEQLVKDLNEAEQNQNEKKLLKQENDELAKFNKEAENQKK